jgi:hypothetical protein
MRRTTDVAMLAALAVIGSILTLQGWRDRPPAIDMVSYFRGAEELLRAGILPVHGDISSYGSFSPPGAAWLMAPGMLLFDDPRLFEKVGSLALHVATLVGVYLLASETLGRAAGRLAAAIYGLSALALAFAGSLWPIGHPVFAVWVTLLAVRWVMRRDPRYLAAAVLLLAVGLYDTLRIAPLALVLPALWLSYRPPISLRSLALAGLVALVIWLPYLGLEVDRGFADLQSQLTLHRLAPTDERSAWCDPALAIRSVEATGSPSSEAPATPSGILNAVATRGLTAAAGVVAPFAESAPVPVAAVLAAFGVTAMLATLLPLNSSRRRARDPDAGRSIQVLLIATGLPWLLLLAIAEPGLTVRFLWLWGLLAIWLAGFITDVLGPRVPRVMVGASAILVLAVVLVHAAAPRLGSWISKGWEGSDPPEVVAAAALAERIHAQARTTAAIGYRLFIYPFMATYSAIDPDYRVGTEFDLLFRYQHGIVNTNRCPEGLSATDEYRIVQTEPLADPQAPRSYVDAPARLGFETFLHLDRYDLLRRAQGGAVPNVLAVP